MKRSKTSIIYDYIAEHPGCKVTDISKAVDTCGSYVRQVVSSLADKGLVQTDGMVPYTVWTTDKPWSPESPSKRVSVDECPQDAKAILTHLAGIRYIDNGYDAPRELTLKGIRDEITTIPYCRVSDIMTAVVTEGYVEIVGPRHIVGINDRARRTVYRITRQGREKLEGFE